MPHSPSSTLAALDLGSNSFHMLVARVDGDRLIVIDKLNEHVRLADGLNETKVIQEDARLRALSVLERFGQRVRDLPTANVRAVGTNTLRKARNASGFLREATALLGHDIEVISGEEEARLVYLGVAHDLDHGEGRRLVVDIGGGSTELIVGEGCESLMRDSTQMGCVTYTAKYFPNGEVSARRFAIAETAARLQVRAIERTYRNLGWSAVLGASGTVRAVDSILRTNRWTARGITAAGIQTLKDALVDAGDMAAVNIPGLSAQRAQVLPGGLAVLSSLFERLDIEEMTASDGALREGLLWDLLGRLENQDRREQTVTHLQTQYGVDLAFAKRVEETALALYTQGHAAWGLPLAPGLRTLSWAARLHEIGLSLSHAGYHRHGAYILLNSALPGFSRDDKELLASVVLGHRRKVTSDRLATILAPRRVPKALRLTVFLRLAHRLHRNRSTRELPPLSIKVNDEELVLGISKEWLLEHPLTQADLEDEAFILKSAGIHLTVAPQPAG